MFYRDDVLLVTMYNNEYTIIGQLKPHFLLPKPIFSEKL
jgi:hypothetical protein